MSDHLVVCDISVKDFENGNEVNKVTLRLERDQPFEALVVKLIAATGVEAER